MAPLQNSSLKEYIPTELLVAQITQLHASISKLESLKPTKELNTLRSDLVRLCNLPSDVDVRLLSEEVLSMRESLIILFGRAEGLMELEFALFLTEFPQPLEKLSLFPKYGNYVNLVDLEHKLLFENGVVHPSKVAFVGSGPIPLTSIIMATHHMKSTYFDNYDIDASANNMARQIVASDTKLKQRMQFKTCDIMEVGKQLGEYDCIFLAALVGIKKEDKVKILGHIRNKMKTGSTLLLRSAQGAKAFLYPIIEEGDLNGFDILSIHHPKGQFNNSIIVARKTDV